MVLGASPNVFVVPAQSPIKSMPRTARQREGQSRQAQLDELRRRHDALSRRRSAEAAHRHRHGAHPVRRRRPGDHGGDRRPGRSLHRQHRFAHGPDRRRQDAADRRHLEGALARPARRSVARGARHQGRGVRHVPGRLCAGRNAAADHRPAGQGDRRDPRAPGREGEIRQGRAAGDGRGPPAAFKARIAKEVPMYKEIIDKADLKIQ